MSDKTSPVFMTTDITPDGLMRIYEKLDPKPHGNVAVKLSTGEPGGHNYLKADLIGDLVRHVGGTIVEGNTAYGGQRGETARHYEIAEEHGFTSIADFQILDENGSIDLPVSGGSHIDKIAVGAHFNDYDWWLSLAHFKGHIAAGLGGAIKNMGIGVTAPKGKLLIHSAGQSDTTWIDGPQDEFLEYMVEAAKGMLDQLGENIIYINVMNRLSVDCDCMSNPAEPDMEDIGILGSLDPVALDRACIDLIYKAPDGASLIERMESRNGAHAIEYAEKIGLGTQSYELISID